MLLKYFKLYQLTKTKWLGYFMSILTLFYFKIKDVANMKLVRGLVNLTNHGDLRGSSLQ